MEFVAELEVGVILSSHLLADLERVCDYLVVLAAARVQLAGDVDDLLAAHYRLIGARGDLDTLPAGIEVIQAEHTARQSTLIVHDTTGALPRLMPDAERLGLEDMILAYLTRAASAAAGLSADRSQAAPGGTRMIWLTWRQFRAQALVAVAALAALTIYLVNPRPADPALVQGQRQLHRLLVLRRPADRREGTYFTTLLLTGFLVVLVPAVIGAFWGAPLIARELETGTHRLVWNQSVTRTRWLAVKARVRRARRFDV